jgi:hypothetical protein
MSAASNQEAMKNYERARDLLLKENKQAFDAVFKNNISKMEMFFKTGGIEQGAIDHLIFQVTSVEMMDLFLRNGGDMDKRGPPPSSSSLYTVIELYCRSHRIRRRFYRKTRLGESD